MAHKAENLLPRKVPGATVRMDVVGPNAGQGLHLFEYLPHVFIVARAPTGDFIGEYPVEHWYLRSDRFPAEWDGCRITAHISTAPGGQVRWQCEQWVNAGEECEAILIQEAPSC